MIKIIAIIGKNNEMGIGNDLLDFYPEDMEHFQKTTKSHMLLMGGNTYKHLPGKKPLPNRFTLVLTSNPKKFPLVKGEMSPVTSFREAVQFYRMAKAQMKEESPDRDLHLFIVGGQQVYENAITKHAVQELLITHIDKAFDNATHFFPKIDPNIWLEDVERVKLSDKLTLVRYIRK
jgi:dihydrofolate reductase